MQRYLDFFTLIEARWGSKPSYGVLLAHFGAASLRKVLLPVTWLQDTGRISVDAAAREADSEHRRVVNLLSSLPRSSQGADALLGYHAKLQAKANSRSISIRSIRLALTPALAVLIEASSDGAVLPSQQALTSYLSRAPGQAAAVYGFVRYLNDVFGTALTAKIDDSVLRARRRRVSEKALLALARHPNGTEEFLAEWVRVGLAYFHDYRKTVGAVARDADENGFRVTVDSREFWIPSWGSVISPKPE